MTSNDSLAPYRGIQAFRYVDREYYFGREELINQLTSKVLLYRLVVLFGESSVGKSSLLNAGLIGALREKGFQPERLRVRPFEAEPITIERIIADRREEHKFLPSIFASDTSADGAPPARVVFCSLERLKARIEAQVDTRVVLIFDQFEELFTLFSQRDTTAAAQLELVQHRLLEMIVAIVGNPQLRVKVVIAIREDYLARLDILAKNYPQVFDNRVLIRQLDKKEAGRAILCPVRSPHHFQSQLTTKLAATIIRELSNNPTHVQIHPTQLQIVCRRLWKAFADGLPVIGTSEFRQMGGTKGIIEGFLASELSEIDSALRPTVLSVLSNLITESGTRDVVSKRKLAALASVKGKKADIEAVLKVLEDRRLINSVAERGTTFYELSNEFLIGPIQKELEQHVIQTERSLARAKAVRSARRAGAFALLLLLVASIVVYARYQSQLRAQQEAEKNKLAAAKVDGEASKDFQTRILIDALSDLANPDAERRRAARTSIMQMAQQNQIPEPLFPLIADVVNSKDKDLASSYLESLNQVILRTPPPVIPTNNPVRVSIQISGEQQRDQARQIKAGLERAGVTVLGVQRVNQGPKGTELRYFIVDDETAANETGSKIKQMGLSGIRSVYVPGYEKSAFAQSGQFELWFPALPQPTPNPTPEPPASPTPSPSSSPLGPGWYIVASFDQPSSFYHRIFVYSVLTPIASRDGVRVRMVSGGAKLGPYATRDKAERSRQLVIDSLKNSTAKLRGEPSIVYEGR